MNRLLLIVVLLALTSCGGSKPQLPEQPPPMEQPTPDNADTYNPYRGCDRENLILGTKLVAGAVPYPFPGSKIVKISITRHPPEGLEDGAAVYLYSLEWDADWVSYASFNTLDNRLVASLDSDGEWTVNYRINLRPYVEVLEDETLLARMRLRARGVKPAGVDTVEALAKFYICDEPVDFSPPPSYDTDLDVVEGDEIGVHGGHPDALDPNNEEGCDGC